MARKKISKAELSRMQTFNDMLNKLNEAPHICESK